MTKKRSNLVGHIRAAVRTAVRWPRKRLRALFARASTPHRNAGVVEDTKQFFSRFGGSRLSLKEQTFFIKRLSFLINAGVPLVESLHVLRGQARSRAQARMVDTIVHDTSNGQPLSRSFKKFPRVFGDFAVHIVKVGEESGMLSQNLNYLADELKKRHTLRRKVISAFIYPIVVTLATLGITAFLMVYLFPKIMPIFSSLHAQLPLSTRVVMAISIFLQHWGILAIFFAVLAAMGGMFLLRRSTTLHRLFDAGVMKLPVVGGMIKNYNVANACRTLGLLLKSGVRLSDALPITADTTKNLRYKEEFVILGEAVNRGERISSRMRMRQDLFPDILNHMIAVGEKSGTLSETLVYLSEMYETEVEEFTKNISTLLEPILMIFMGLLVGFIAISIITPIYGITQNLHN